MKTKTTIELDLTKLGVEKAILDENGESELIELWEYINYPKPFN